MTMIKRLLGFCCVIMSLQISAQNIWKSVDEAIKNSGAVSFEEIKKHISLITSDFKENSGEIIVGDGYIVIDANSIRSYDSVDHEKLEYEYKFSKNINLSSMPKNDREDLKDISISLDICRNHKYFKENIGSFSYEDFVDELQNTLEITLQEKKALVSRLRSKTSEKFNAEEINKNPPHIVISTQFNDDKQNCMTTFCGGNISKGELGSEKQRARFIHGLLTDKAFKSLMLGASIAEHCQKQLKVSLLDWQTTNFENTSCPVQSEFLKNSLIKFQERDKRVNGILMRNLMHNGIFSKAFVMPFPDMKWIREQVKAGEEITWIKQYAHALTEAVVEYVTTSKYF